LPRSSPEHSGSSALLIRSGKPRSPNAEYAGTGGRSRSCPSHRRTDVPRPSSFPTEFAPLVLKGALLCQTKRNPFEGSPDAEQHRVFPCKWRFLISSAGFHVCGRERTVGSPRADLAISLLSHPVQSLATWAGFGDACRGLSTSSAWQFSVICTGNRTHGEELVPGRDETCHPFVAFVSNAAAIRLNNDAPVGQSNRSGMLLEYVL
jgi:hypothetical protein